MKQIVLVFSLLTLGMSCSELLRTEPVVAQDSTGDPREWLLVLLAFDDNELRSSTDQDIRELTSAADDGHRIHRLTIRDSRNDGNRITVVDSDGERPLNETELPAGSLFDGATSAALLSRLQSLFPAKGTILVLSGHGRGRRGFGVSDTDPTVSFTDRELTKLFQALSPEEHPEYLVVDGSYGVQLEFLYPVVEAETTVIAHTGNLLAGGLDYRLLGSVVSAHRHSDPEILPALVGALDNASTSGQSAGSGAFALTPGSIAAAVATIPFLADAGRDATGDLLSQETLRSDLLSQAITPGVPGDASITLGRVLDHPLMVERLFASHGDFYADTSWRQLSLHLVIVDEIGSPTGHDLDYRPDLGTSDPPQFCFDTRWAPDLTHSSGFLYYLWYRTL